MVNRRFVSLLVLALLLPFLNCWKALQGDEDAYTTFAMHIAAHPFDPYGFRFDFDGNVSAYHAPAHNVPANHVLAPPVVLYWWALAIRLFGVQPVWWKLWLLPFSMLLVFALYALFRRLSRGLEMPLVWLSERDGQDDSTVPTIFAIGHRHTPPSMADKIISSELAGRWSGYKPRLLFT